MASVSCESTISMFLIGFCLLELYQVEGGDQERHLIVMYSVDFSKVNYSTESMRWNIREASSSVSHLWSTLIKYNHPFSQGNSVRWVNKLCIALHLSFLRLQASAGLFCSFCSKHQRLWGDGEWDGIRTGRTWGSWLLMEWEEEDVILWLFCVCDSCLSLVHVLDQWTTTSVCLTGQFWAAVSGVRVFCSISGGGLSLMVARLLLVREVEGKGNNMWPPPQKLLAIRLSLPSLF